jgi:hypothetical protein
MERLGLEPNQLCSASNAFAAHLCVYSAILGEQRNVEVASVELALILGLGRLWDMGSTSACQMYMIDRSWS